MLHTGQSSSFIKTSKSNFLIAHLNVTGEFVCSIKMLSGGKIAFRCSPAQMSVGMSVAPVEEGKGKRDPGNEVDSYPVC